MTTNCMAVNRKLTSLASLHLAVWLAATLAGGAAPVPGGRSDRSEAGALALGGFGDSLVLEFPAAHIRQRLLEPSLKLREGQRLLLAYDAESPDGVPLRIERRLETKTERDGEFSLETFSLSAARPAD